MTSIDEPMYKIKPSHHFQALVSCLSHLENTIRNIKAKLNPNQLALFRKTKLGHFLDLNIVFNGPLIHYLLLREVKEEEKDHISFLLGSVVCTFGRREFNIVTGLWGPEKEDPEKESIQPVGNSRLLEKFFKDKKSIYVRELEDTFLEYGGDDDDMVKLALVYFIELSLLGKDRRTKVNRNFLKIAEDWNTFDNYDWGEIVFRRTLNALKRALDMQYVKGKKVFKKKYTILGFPHALQVWAYESISTIIGCGVEKINDDVIPRMLRWVCQQSSKSYTIQSQVFDSPMLIIKAVIEMTPEEEQLRISSSELFDKLHSSNIVHMKNGGSKRGREVSNDGGDLKKSKKQKLKSKMKEVIRNLEDRVTVVESQITSLKSDIEELKGMMFNILEHIGLKKKDNEGDRMRFEGSVDHTLQNEEVDAQVQDVNTTGTPPWLRIPKKDDNNNTVKVGDEHQMNALGNEVHIELENSSVLVKLSSNQSLQFAFNIRPENL